MDESTKEGNSAGDPEKGTVPFSASPWCVVLAEADESSLAPASDAGVARATGYDPLAYLDDALARALAIAPPARTVVLVREARRRDVREILGVRRDIHELYQPDDHDTGLAVALSTEWVRRRDPDARIIFLAGGPPEGAAEHLARAIGNPCPCNDPRRDLLITALARGDGLLALALSARGIGLHRLLVRFMPIQLGAIEEAGDDARSIERAYASVGPVDFARIVLDRVPERICLRRLGEAECLAFAGAQEV